MKLNTIVSAGVLDTASFVFVDKTPCLLARLRSVAIPSPNIHGAYAEVLMALWLAFVSASQAGAQIPYNSLVSRILGQAVLQRSSLTAVAPNLAEGREVYNPQSVALDTSVSPPILYVADTGNNRVLAWKNPASGSNGTAANLVIGQPNGYSTTAQGPSAGSSSAISYGFSAPVSVIVDVHGNLYVADAGNNRILRFPRPFSQSGGLNPPDLVLGQTSVNSSAVNQGESTPSANTLYLSGCSGPCRAGMAFDGQNNLWVSDPGNNRVLRYPVSVLGSQPSNGPNADTVLGQSDFRSHALPSGATATGKNFLAIPAYLALDPSGRLYVSDDFNRVVVFQNPLITGSPAARIMGVVIPTASNPNPAAVSASTLGAGSSPPQGIFFIASNPYVFDTPNSRILGYPPFPQWPPETQAFSPAATVVIGQPDFSSSKANQGSPQPSAVTLFLPETGAFSGTDLFVADSGNNRILDLPLSGVTFGAAVRVLGQGGVKGNNDFAYNSVNLIEGREFKFSFSAQQNGATVGETGGGVAIDNTANPPHLYVADPGNNRVLGFKNLRQAVPGQMADLVIGEPDFNTAVANYPTNDSNTPSISSLNVPTSVAVDSSGNLWVADSGNGRVLRFPRPFELTTSPQANLVIGQLSFNQSLTGATSQTMGFPDGIAFTNEGGLLVSDGAYNRVLYFRKPGGDFTNGQTATSVIGQPDFTSSAVNNPAVGNGGLANPHGIGLDNNDTLYVADPGNGRIAIFSSIPSGINGPNTSLAIGGLNNPQSVVIHPTTQEIWVANTNSAVLLRYQSYNSILQGNTTPTAQIPDYLPLSIALDGYGNPVVAEGGANRVSFYYPQMFPVHGANYFQRYAPGMLASLFPGAGTQFGATKQSATTIPIPTTLGGVQVFVNGVASPIFYAAPGQINFQIPIGTPTGQQEITVISATTNQVLADSFVPLNLSAPGLFTTDSTGNNQLSAINADDSTPNGVKHPVKAGHYISLYGTGQGFVNGAPPDGELPKGTVNTPSLPLVYAGGANFLPSSAVEFSGLAPCCVGLWQINFQVPSNAAPGPNLVFVQYQGANSKNDGSGQSGVVNGVQHSVETTIYVTQ